jgi:hypothetical protein
MVPDFSWNPPIAGLPPVPVAQAIASAPVIEVKGFVVIEEP